MLELNKIYCESCYDTMFKLSEEGTKVNIILTSPPYNTSYNDKGDKYHHRYGEYCDIITPEEYVEKTVKLFETFNTILEKDGVILYNLSYHAQNPSSYIDVVYNITHRTVFTLADTIIWKKKHSFPDNASPNRLSRKTEFVFVFVRKDEIKSFQCNKELTYIGKNNHKVYSSIDNFIEARNNDGSTEVNKATYSTELCNKLLDIYAKENDLVYDPFMGTGTTAVSSLSRKCRYLGSEIEQKQVDYANNRLTFFESCNRQD